MGASDVCFSYLATEVDYADQAVIYQEGSEGDWIYVVLRGQVKMKKATARGPVVIATLKEGDVFGELGFFDKVNRARTETIVADGPVHLGIFDIPSLDREIDSASPRFRILLRTIVYRLKETINKIGSVVAE